MLLLLMENILFDMIVLAGSCTGIYLFELKYLLPAGMGLWTLLEGFLLLANALAILNEDRFLGPRGWSMSEVSGNGQTKSLKGQIVGLIYATQFLRMPLIALNVLIIVVKLVSG
jgi:hypothetical protein